MHHHAYLWTGPTPRFDEEAFRRPPHPQPPPLETAYWLVKPRSIVKGTWSEPSAAAVWLGERPAEYARRFAACAYRDPGRLATLLASAGERLAAGGDISLGFSLEQPAFLSVALVGCGPHRALPDLPCPFGR
ncbi:hypothetical protein ACF1DV_21535 [Streptomyces achromogenes]|uniref:hypothetical protein n=1 Tax=Streptomyces achromogenes TaxID=67255 RepID=UPI003700B4E9